MHQENPPAKVASNDLLGPKVWARKDQLQHASTRGGLMCAMYPDTNGRADLEPLYDQTAIDAAADEARQTEAASWGENAAMQAAEIERLQALLLLQQASYEREIAQDVAAERARCCAILKAREVMLAAEAEKATLREPDEVSALRAMAWQLAVAEREIRGA